MRVRRYTPFVRDKVFISCNQTAVFMHEVFLDEKSLENELFLAKLAEVLRLCTHYTG